mgnify:CR=1 FL=1
MNGLASYNCFLFNNFTLTKKIKTDAITMWKCNASGRGVSAFTPCSNTANPSLTDDGFKMMFNKKPAWLRAGLKGNRFKIPHSTSTNRCAACKKP